MAGKPIAIVARLGRFKTTLDRHLKDEIGWTTIFWVKAGISAVSKWAKWLMSLSFRFDKETYVAADELASKIRIVCSTIRDSRILPIYLQHTASCTLISTMAQ